LHASQIAETTGLNRNTVNRYLKELRKLIASHCEAQSLLSGKVEVDEMCFASKETFVFGIFQRKGNVYTKIVPNFSEETLEAVIRARVSPESIFYFDHRTASDGLFDTVYHFKIYNSRELYEPNLDGIRSFWAYAKTRLSKFRGMSEFTFYLHLKECEYRFNHRYENIYLLLLRMCRENPLD
jgi:transposase-like protein